MKIPITEEGVEDEEEEEEDTNENRYKKKVEREDEYDEEGVFDGGREEKNTRVPRMTVFFNYLLKIQ